MKRENKTSSSQPFSVYSVNKKNRQMFGDLNKKLYY